MIRLSRWQTFFIGFGIIAALFLGERLLFLHKAVEHDLTTKTIGMAGSRRGVTNIQFMYLGKNYEFRTYGFSSLGDGGYTILLDPDNPDKAYINTAAEIWIPRGVGHLLALIVWYMVVSSFITNREHVRLSMKGISREKENKTGETFPYNQRQLGNKK